jgi:hypothetical protein
MSTIAAHLDEFPFAQVSSWLTQGEIIPFVGAGASSSEPGATTGLPDGKRLAGELASFMPGSTALGEQDNLAKVAQVYQHTVFDRDALYKFLHRRLEIEQARTPPGAVAKMLASIPTGSDPLFLITTNYDSFIERAFRDAGRPLCTITQNMRDPESGASKISLIYPDGYRGQEDSLDFQWTDRRFEPGTAFLFKMHGSVQQAPHDGPDDVIITEDDYVDFMVNSGGAISPYFPPAALTSAYKRRRFLFLGYSLYDWNFRTFLRMLTIRNCLTGRGIRRHYAIQLSPAAAEVELWRQRGVNLYEGDLAEFCARIITSLAGAG